MKPEFHRAALLGVGMVGGSLGKALLDRGLVKEVAGYDASDEVLLKAKSLGAITQAAATVKEAVSGSDLVILAVPVMAAVELLPEVAPHMDEHALITDVCSTKGIIMQRAAEILPPAVSFVGGHPMAGSEKDGVTALDANLFENAIYVVCSDNEAARKKMEQLVKGIGAVPVILTPEKHDFLVAAVSHLPHLTATSLSRVVAGLEDINEILLLAAGGFRDTTRIAMGSPQMWYDICFSNRNHILFMLDQLINEITSVRELVAAGSAEGLITHFQEARDFRLQVPSHGRGILPHVYNLYVYVPDKPGIIGEVAGKVGRAGVNIAEIELLRVREEEGGPLRFGFMSGESRRLAASLLEAEGYRVELQEG